MFHLTLTTVASEQALRQLQKNADCHTQTSSLCLPGYWKSLHCGCSLAYYPRGAQFFFFPHVMVILKVLSTCLSPYLFCYRLPNLCFLSSQHFSQIANHSPRSVLQFFWPSLNSDSMDSQTYCSKFCALGGSPINTASPDHCRMGSRCCFKMMPTHCAKLPVNDALAFSSSETAHPPLRS